MSFVYGDKLGQVYAPGWFLAHEECERKTKQIAQNHAQVVTANGTKHVPMGAFWPANDSSTVVGIVYEDVDVTSGDMPGSVVTKGVVYLDRLPAAPESGVQSALEGKGFTFISSAPSVTRPTSYNKSELGAITVASVAGSGAGKTDVSISGYTKDASESYYYKVADAEVGVYLGQVLDLTGWTAGTFPLDELTATTGKVITVVAIDSIGAVVAAGKATITSHA